MSTFETEGYQWRETYFVLFDASKRPPLDAIRETLQALNPRFELINIRSDDAGNFESLTLRSTQDYAALDISFVVGDEVREQAETLAKEMKSPGITDHEKAEIARLARCDARFDVLHFEQVSDDFMSEDPDEMLDPSALLIALDALADLTDGISIDPQSGAIM